MFAHERHGSILKLLQRKQRLTVTELLESLKVSPATLRRDLAVMEEAGKVLRVHGGLVDPRAYNDEPSFHSKARESVGAKRMMARAIRDFLNKPCTVFIDAGTTCLEVGRLLLGCAEIRTITNSVPLLCEAHKLNKPIISLGGELRALSGALVGQQTLSGVQQFRADWAIIGASGLSATDGISTTEMEEASIKRWFLTNGSQRILVADGSKWNRPSLLRFAVWKDFNFWFTTSEVRRSETHSLEKAGLRVVRCTA